MAQKNGFTLVELMIVVAIVAILAVVAIPAYINYVNRSKQGGAESLLMTARAEQEEYYTDNGWYAATIQCLPSFAGTSATPQNTYTDPTSGYQFAVLGTPTTNDYQVRATRTINGVNDVVTAGANTNTPWVQNTTALHFSIFQWLFGH